MNGFCTNLTERLINRFKIDATVFVSKKKKHIHLSLKKPLFEHRNYKQIIRFIRKYSEDRIMFCEPYVLNFPKLSQSIKWRHEYILAIKKSTAFDTMDAMLDRFFEEVERNFKENFKQYRVEVSEMSGSFFVLVKRRRGKILGEQQKLLFDTLKKLTEDTYLKFSNMYSIFEKSYIPYFRLAKSYGIFHFHVFSCKKRLWLIACL